MILQRAGGGAARWEGNLTSFCFFFFFFLAAVSRKKKNEKNNGSEGSLREMSVEAGEMMV